MSLTKQGHGPEDEMTTTLKIKLAKGAMGPSNFQTDCDYCGEVKRCWLAPLNKAGSMPMVCADCLVMEAAMAAAPKAGDLKR